MFMQSNEKKTGVNEPKNTKYVCWNEKYHPLLTEYVWEAPATRGIIFCPICHMPHKITSILE